jgi:membrane associated rhomboid family serine protease
MTSWTNKNVMAPVTRLLVVANVGVFLLESILGNSLVTNLALWPLGQYSVPVLNATVGFRFWQLVTSGFLHANLLHLGLNMYALYMFGSDVERALG